MAPGLPGHLIRDISYSGEWIVCTCGARIEARADTFESQRHQPLVDAWNAHRVAVGAIQHARPGRPRRGKAFTIRGVAAGGKGLASR